MATKFTYDFALAGNVGGAAGWSESHIIDSDADDLTTYFAVGIRLGAKRMGWAAANVILNRFRVSSIGKPRVFEVYYTTQQGLGMGVLPANGQLAGVASDIVSTSLRISLRASSANKGRLYAAGIPDDIIKTATIAGGVLTPSGPDLGGVAGFLNAYLSWKAQLSTDHWCFRGRQRNAPLAIASWVQAPGAPFQLILQTSQPLNFPGGNPPNWPQGALLQVRGVANVVKGTPTINGKVRVLDYATNGTTYSYTLLNSQGFQATDILRNGTVEVVSYQQWPIIDAFVEGQGSRKRGVGSIRRRGRSKTRRPSLV